MALVPIVAFVPTPAQEEPSWVAAVNQSYRFSFANVTHLALFSGLGVESPEERWALLRERARAEAVPWRNLYLNSAPFAEGSPVLTQKFSATNAATLRWERAKMKTVVEPEGLAWAVIAYISWLRQIEQGCQRAPFSASLYRLIAMTLGDLAAQALQFAEKHLKDTQTGLYGQDWAAQIAMLHALAAFALGTADSEFYLGELSSVTARAQADALFRSILKENDPPWPAQLRLQALWLEALAWYALVGSYPLEALRLLHQLAQQWQSAAIPNIAARAALLTALLTASRLTGEQSYAEQALGLWEGLQDSWERARAFSVSEIGDLVGAFNAVIRVLKLEEAQSGYARFFALWVKRLQRAEESGSGHDDDILMTQAGGPHGQAPVFGTEIAYDERQKRWVLLDGRFSTSGALYTASRLLWLSGSCGEGFSGPPAYGLPQSSWIKLATVSEGAPTVPATTAQTPTPPASPAKELKELDELRAQLQGALERIAGLERTIEDLTQRLQKAEQEIAELRQRPQTEMQNLQQQLQKSQDEANQLSLRVQQLEQRAPEFPWAWILLILLVIGTIFWLYLRVRRREFGEFTG